MVAWVRNVIMILVMLIWALYILISLIRRDDIETIVWGLPGAIYLALNPNFKRTTSDSNDKSKGNGT